MKKLEQTSRHSFNSTRREFLHASACGVAAGTALIAGMPSDVLAGSQPQDRSSTNRGIIFKSVKGGAIGGNKQQMISRLKGLKELGFDGIEGGSPEIKDKQALREAIQETGMPVHGVVDGVHWRDRLSSPDPAVRQRGLEALEQAVQDTYDIGGSAVLLVPGRVAGPDENHDHVWQRSTVEIRKVLPRCSRLGIHILIENVWNGFCESADQYRDYIDQINSPWVGAYFDIGNVRKFGPPEQWIRVLGKRIIKLDVKDWGKKNGFCKLGQGDVNWPEVRKALADIGFSGWATREGSDGGDDQTARLMDELLDL